MHVSLRLTLINVEPGAGASPLAQQELANVELNPDADPSWLVHLLAIPAKKAVNSILEA